MRYPLIYLADLCYLHDWDNNQPVPLNVGYIGAYLKKHIPEVSIEIFKDPRQLVDRISETPPDILALSHYDWNANLDLTVLRHAKNLRPDTITVFGGPDFVADDTDWIHDFFSHRPELDLYITNEGEWSFTRLIELLQEYDGKVENIPYDIRPSSYFAFDRERGSVIHNPRNPVARLDLSTVPSPYLTGLMDPFLQDMRLAPIFESNRGCPYSCAFCCWGQATQSKVNRFPLEQVVEEIRYATSQTKNPAGFVYVADGNFGIYKDRDEKISEIFQECSERYGTPKRIFIYFAKNTTESIINIAENLNSVTSMSMSKQTMNPDVLENIKRKNIPFEQYDRLRIECEKRNIDTFCELIYGLAGETYQSYVDGVIGTVRTGQRVTMYPQMMIAGAEASSREYRKKFGIKTAFRIIPRYVSSYKDIHSLEYEELVIETDAMSKEDYFQIRMFQFLCFVLGSEMFVDFVHGLDSAGLDFATIADVIAKDENNWTPIWGDILREHRQASEDELIPEDALKLEFTAEDIAGVDRNQLALNPFYISKLVSSSQIVKDFHEYFESVLDRFFASALDGQDLEEIKVALDLSFDKIVRYDDVKAEKIKDYNYDLDAWSTDENKKPLKDFYKETPVRYCLKLDDDVLPAIEKARNDTGDLAQAIYRVRTNTIGPAGDRIYTYKRVTESAFQGDKRDQAEAERERREAHRQHSETASRMS